MSQSSSKHALICGITGQDGSYLARLLLEKGYQVTGTSRDAQVASFANLDRLGIRDRVQVESMSLTDFRSTLQKLSKVRPDEVYNLAGQTSVALSFEQPMEAMESISVGALNLLESIRFLDKRIRLYNASSSECFGDTGHMPADENTPFRPRSPYALAKSAAHWAVANYRDAYGIHACSGILFNHELPLRPRRFVSMKIVAAACAIKKGSHETLRLGNIDVCRDWGAAEEYVEAMWRMMQLDAPADFVIATGKTNSLRDFVAATFAELGLDWTRHVEIDEALRRPSDIAFSAANPEKSSQVLGWRASQSMPDVIRRMVADELVAP